jgi:hypothetical protein
MPITVSSSTITTDLASISNSGTNYGISISSNGIVRFPLRPMFYAYGIAGGTFAVGSFQIYPTTQVNQGNHYNTANGRFTAPIAGIYQFHWSNIAANTSGVYRFYFRVNGSNINDIHLRIDNTDTGSAYGTNAAYSITYPLQVNDFVQIFYSAGPVAMYPGTNSPTDDYPQFCGWLVG